MPIFLSLHAESYTLFRSIVEPCMLQIKLIDQGFFWDIVDLRILQPDWLGTFLAKFTNYLLCFLNLYLHAKNEVDAIIIPWNIADLRILQSDWIRAFCVITQELEFPQKRNLCRLRAYKMNFHLTPDPENSRSRQLFWETSKTLIFSHLGPIEHFWKKKRIFLKI